jgi:hypothetical protein
MKPKCLMLVAGIERLDDEREAMGEIIARSAVEPHPFAGLAQ